MLYDDARMAEDFLTEFLGNKVRARLVRVFVFSQSGAFTASMSAKRAGISITLALREIKALERIGVLKKSRVSITLANKTKRIVLGKQKEHTWSFHKNFKHARALSSFIHEISPMQYDEITKALKRTGRLAVVILSGSFMGDVTRPADLLVAGDSLQEGRLEQAIRALEPRFGREIRYAAFSTPEFRYRLTIQDRLIRDTLDYPHLVLLDKAHLL